MGFTALADTTVRYYIRKRRERSAKLWERDSVSLNMAITLHCYLMQAIFFIRIFGNRNITKKKN